MKKSIRRIFTKIRAKNCVIVPLVSGLTLMVSSCGSPPERPAFTQADTVGTLSSQGFVGSWRYTVLNPAVPEENDNQTIYDFNSDGTFVGNSNNKKMAMQMISTGTWSVDGESFVINVEDVKETSGNALAGLAVSMMKGYAQKQGGNMNPYSMTTDQIVMYSTENKVAVQLDRIN